MESAHGSLGITFFCFSKSVLTYKTWCTYNLYPAAVSFFLVHGYIGCGFTNSRYNKKLSAKQARQYAEYILQAGDKFGQEPFVLAAMVVHESSANASAVSRGGDYGLMQVRWNVHKKRIMREYPSVKKAKDFLDPRINIMVGTEIFTDYRAAAGPDLRAGLLRYSAGNKKLANKIFATVRDLEAAQNRHLKAVK